MDRTGHNQLTQNKPVLQRQVSHIFYHLWKQGKNKIKQNQGHENKRGPVRMWKKKGKRTKNRRISKNNREEGYDQSTLYVYVKISS
jgi:hypothetical protein